jgi:uncharacterized protein
VRSLQLSRDIKFPIDIAGQAIALFGIRGSGKTNTAGALAEELLDNNYPIAVIDPTDAWWGLRASRDGTQAGGYPVFIFGGSHADLPLTETDGKIIAEFLVREQVPVILSLRHLRKAAQRRFVTEFCEELYHLKGKDENRTPLTVFIDEAPLFVPQKVMGEVARTVGAVEDLIARGRNAGFGVVLISQRSATLNADVRTQADTIICHRVTSPLDRRAISDWFEENATTDDLKTILQSLATLKNGEAWVWSPSLDIMKRAQLRLRRTFDSSATPKAGAKLRPPKKLADVDLAKLKGQLATAIEKAKADDPKELRRRIAELEREVKAKPAAAPKPVAPPKKVEVQVLTASDRKLLERAETAARVGSAKAQDLYDALAKLSDRIEKATAVVPTLPVDPAFVRAFNGPLSPALQRAARLGLSPSFPKASAAPPPNTRSKLANTQPLLTNDTKLGRGERATMIAIAQHPNGVTPTQLTALTGYKRSTRDAYLQRLRAAGFVNGFAPTEAGIAWLGPDYEPLPTGDALREHWMRRLPEGERKVLEIACRNYPADVDRAIIDQETGYARSTRDAYIQRLAAKKLVKDDMPGAIAASAELFS